MMTSSPRIQYNNAVLTTNATILTDTLNNDHGHSSELISPWFKSVTFMSLTVTCVLGTIANLLVAFIIIRRRKIKRVIHFLTLNLAISDLMVLLIYLPLQLNSINKQLKWDLGRISCRFFYMVNAFTVNASICTLIAITRDRYLAISYPMMTHSRGIESIKCWIPIIWFASFAMTIPLLFVVDVNYGYCIEDWPNLVFERMYWISIFVIQILLPLVCFTISYSVIIYRFGKGSKAVTGGQRRCRSKRRQQKRRLLQMAIMLTVVYLICSLPQHLVFFAVTFEVLQHNPNAVYIFIVSNFLMILNSAINPVIYGSQSDEVKREFFKIFPCFSTVNTLVRRTILRRRTSYTSNSLLQPSLKSYKSEPLHADLKKKKVRICERKACIKKKPLRETVVK